MRSRVVTIAVISLLVLFIATPAMGKVIPTDTEVTVDGQTAIVTVDVDSHTGLGGEEWAHELGNMVALYPTEALDESGRPSPGDTGTPLQFQMVDDFTYRAVLEFPEGGEWAIVPFPLDPSMSAAIFPTTTFTVADAGAPLLAIGGLVLAVLLVGAVVTWIVTRGRRLQRSAAVAAPRVGQA